MPAKKKPALSDFRVDEETDEDPTTPKLVHILDIAPAWAGRILSFDQTITKCGWSLINIIPTSSGEFTISLKETGMIVPPPELDTGKKIETKLAQANYCFIKASALIAASLPTVVAFEQPPAGGGSHFKNKGGGMRSPEASLLAATVIQPAVYMADNWHMNGNRATSVMMINPQVWQRRFTGLTGDKKAVRAEITRRYPQFAEIKPSNENTWDSIAVGLTACERPLS